MQTTEERTASEPAMRSTRGWAEICWGGAMRLGRKLLRLTPFLIGCAILITCAILTACGGGSTRSGSPAGSSASPAGSALSRTNASGGAATVTAQANDFLFKFNRTAVPAGAVHFVLENQSKTYQHELWIYPQTQPRLSAFLQAEDAGQNVNAADYLQGVAGHIGPIDPGKTASLDVQLQPGTYEMSCLVASSIAGKTMVHYEMGMHGLLTVS